MCVWSPCEMITVPAFGLTSYNSSHSDASYLDKKAVSLFVWPCSSCKQN